MKLINHVLKIRSLVQQAIDNRFAKMGIKETGLVPAESLPQDLIPKRQKLEDILNNHLSELQDYSKARQETINECTFTLFNKIAAIKVMEEKELFPEVIKRRPENGNKSFAHNLWLEENPGEKSAERQGLKHFLQAKFNELGENFSLYNENYPYSLMPTADELYNILEAFNEVEDDPECGADVWKGDDILGWLYEDFNATEKEVLKNSDEKTEYDKVSLQSQVYTPRWVVKFLVDNTLGKMYLEMFPDSDIVKPDENGDLKYKIANAPASRKRDIKKMEEIRVIDPACGSGNFLIYAFDLLYDLYVNQIEQYGAEYSRRDIPRLILENNIYGVDLDERAVQLSQIALFIKAREKGGRRAKNPSHTNVVSTHFFLPDYSEVESEFIASGEWDQAQRGTIRKIWSDLQNAHKFGSLVRVEEVLNGLSLKEDEGTLFSTEIENDLFSFKRRVTDVLHDQVKSYCEKNTSEYALTKAEDAMTFLNVLSMPFDVVVANPPYTDSANFGVELKAFVDSNYHSPLKFNSNLYSCFIKRTCELAGDEGKVGMVNPPTFMYIKSFEDTRKFILEQTHIDLFIEWGYLGMFSSFARVDSAMFVLDKYVNSKSQGTPSIFIKLNDLYEMKRKDVLEEAYGNLCDNIPNPRVYILSQNKLKTIKSFPFIYWISDEFRLQFAVDDLDTVLDVRQGLASGDNARFLRYWWEVDPQTISVNKSDTKKWVNYVKGGPFNKWYGNNWLVIAFDKHNQDVLSNMGNHLPSRQYYRLEGVTYSSVGSKGASFRYLPENFIFDVGGSCIFPNKYKNISYYLGLLNSSLASYICDCLNPTVNTNQGDLKRIPFALPNSKQESIVAALVNINISIKQNILSFSIIEQNYSHSPISTNSIQEGLKEYYVRENALNTIVLLNESVINETIFSVYNLSEKDRSLVFSSCTLPIGSLPVTREAKSLFIGWITQHCPDYITEELLYFINGLEEKDNPTQISDFEVLFQNNNGWEEFCISHHINPIDVWHQFNEAGVLPPARSQTLSFELITDVIRVILAKDDDGIIPLSEKMGEERLAPRIEQELSERGYSAGQISQIINLLGLPLTRYLQERFFIQLTEHLNLFMYLPKTPFIWHLSSGPKHAIELYISIYKWDRDALFKIKSVYTARRESALKDRLAAIDAGNTLDQMEAQTIKEQLEELRLFVDKIDDLLANGYNPRLDDGVAKNIAPLQKRKMIPYEVLNASQLKKYLNADW